MRLNKYLTEERQTEEEFEQMTKILERDCGPFLKAMAKSMKNVFLYRGISRTLRTDNVGLEKKTVRKNRKPKDIPEQLHSYINEELNYKFGWSPRSEGVFATSSFMTAADFGIPYLFFPIGKFKFVWGTSKESGGLVIGDLLGELDREGLLIWQQGKYIIDVSLTWEEIEKKVDYILEGYTDKNLRKAIVKGAEIMFKCDSYYLIDKDDVLYQKLVNWVWK